MGLGSASLNNFCGLWGLDTAPLGLTLGSGTVKAAGQQPRRMAAQYRTWLGDVHSRLFGLRTKNTLTKEPLLQGLASPGGAGSPWSVTPRCPGIKNTENKKIRLVQTYTSLWTAALFALAKCKQPQIHSIPFNELLYNHKNKEPGLHALIWKAI